LIQTRMVSSCLFLIGVPVGKHVIWYTRIYRIEIYFVSYLRGFLVWWCHHCHRNASFAPKCPYWGSYNGGLESATCSNGVPGKAGFFNRCTAW
jgi:hypothetical protein